MRHISILAVVLLSTVVSFGQTNKGGISGTVTDASGAVIPGATVTITNLGTSQRLTLTTSDDGTYAAASLEPVTYRVTTELPGFKKSVVENVKVDTATTVTVNVRLEPGEVLTEVTVTAEAPLLNRESGTTSQTVTERQIQDIPLNNRSVLDLAVTAANVSGDAGSEDPEVTSGQPVPGFNLSLNGGRPGSTAILADGVNNTGVGIARAVVSFTPETVQEFTVQTSAYDAQFGQTAGGVINATTKSGTNRLNGMVLWYHRNPVTNARRWTTGTLRPPNNLRYNQVSVTVGGPVVLPKIYNGRNRTFFFFAYEPRWRRDFVVTDALLPTDAMRTGDFTGLARVANGWVPADVVTRFGIPVTSTNTTIYQQYNLAGNKLIPITLGTGEIFQPFVGNKIPKEMINPIAVKALDFMPHAGGYFINETGILANYVVNRFVRQDETRCTTRIDHQLSSNNRINLRFTKVPAVGIRGFGSEVNGNTAAYSDSKQLVVADTQVFSSKVINDLRLNYTRGVFSEDFSPEFSIKGGRNLSQELGIPSLTTGGLPLFQFLDITGNNTPFVNIGSSGSTNNFNAEERYNINDVLYWNRGKMSWKFGLDLSHALLNVIPFFAASGGRWDFRTLQTSNNRTNQQAAGGNSFASFLIGVSNAALVRPILIPYYYRWNSAAAFVQDDWKVRPNLTLNLGLRYSLQLPRTEKYNRQGVFLPELAKQFPLAAPVTLAGKTFTSALVPPFAYAGRGGRSKYIFPVEYMDFEPRFGFAWAPNLFGWSGSGRIMIRGGYGISHAPLTGNNRAPNPDFGATNNVGTTATGSSGTADPNQPLAFSNPPVYSSLNPEKALNIPNDGLVYLDSLAIPGFAISGNTRIPYLQNWNLTLSYEPAKNTIVEVAYVGSKGTNLYMPRVNINPRDLDFVEFLEANNLSADTNINDPLGRRALNGTTLAVPRGSLDTKFLGFNNLLSYFDASANSIRHAMYIDVRRRVSRGLTFTANYNYGKSIDDASDASPDTRVLSTTSTAGHVTFGAPRYIDRAISIYDIKHIFNSTFIYDFPFGRGRRFLSNSWEPVEWAAGGWTVAGVFRLQGGYPFVPSITDTNRLSGNITHTIRPDLVSGVPLHNSLWKRGCPVGNLCEPYINPAAFMRPAKGALGDAPRTLDIRGPRQRYFDVSLQKNFRIGERGRRVQLRVDMINAFNHPNFRLNNLDMGGLPDETPISTGDYDAWMAAASGRPARSTPTGAALFSQIQSFVTGSRLASGALPLDFFANVRLPQGFASTDANAFDISTLAGFKLYRLRRAYDTNYGTLRETGLPRYVQFGLRIYF
ncbi:MAG TPA: carboxypeptidase regulatory-like domain-containing protein [Acidobacteriota bacterium]